MRRIPNPVPSKCLMCGNDYLREWSNQKYCGSAGRKLGCSYTARRNKFARINKDRKVNFALLKSRKKKTLIQGDFTCKICGLRDEASGFMDIDHKDGNRQNNEIKNLWVLCPNCHRRKTIESK